jgi:hypothetical protein
VTILGVIANGIGFGEKGLKFFVKQGFGIGTGGDSKHGDFLVCKREMERKKTLDQSPTKVYTPGMWYMRRYRIAKIGEINYTGGCYFIV